MILRQVSRDMKSTSQLTWMNIDDECYGSIQELFVIVSCTLKFDYQTGLTT